MKRRKPKWPQHGTNKRNEVKRAAKEAATIAPGKMEAHPYYAQTHAKRDGS